MNDHQEVHRTFIHLATDMPFPPIIVISISEGQRASTGGWVVMDLLGDDFKMTIPLGTDLSV